MRRVAAALALTALLASCVDESNGGTAGGQGIRGVVLAGPQCPAETAESPCPDRPLPDVRVDVRRDGETVAEATTGADGRFAVAVEPGSYEVEAASGQEGFMSSKPVAVEVRPGAYTDVTVSVDTGIR